MKVLNHKEIHLKIGLKIKELRQQQNLSQLKLAKSINKSKALIYRIEAGKNNTTLDVLIDLSNVLKFNLLLI